MHWSCHELGMLVPLPAKHAEVSLIKPKHRRCAIYGNEYDDCHKFMHKTQAVHVKQFS